ncbi:trace amine-associated receptor 1-like [Aulostomus maculatus]
MELTFFTNRTEDFLEEKPPCNETEDVYGSVFFKFAGSLSVVIMCGNLLIITSIVYFKQLHTPTNYLILSLALADLLVGALVIPFSAILSVRSCCDVESLLYKVRGGFDMLLCTASILNLCFISVDRYYAVCQPLRYRHKITNWVAAIMILVSWTVSALVGIGVSMKGVNKKQSDRKCLLFQNKSSPIIGAVFAFFLPAIMMVTIYVKILMVAWRQARSIHNTTMCGATLSRMERKATKTLAIVMGAFLTCWTPFFLCIFLLHLNESKVAVPVTETFKWFGWSNSMLNPLVYAFFYSWFRSAVRMILSGKIFQVDLTNTKLS